MNSEGLVFGAFTPLFLLHSMAAPARRVLMKMFLVLVKMTMRERSKK